MADQVVRSYDPKKIIATFGPVVLSGWGKGSFLTISQNGDSFEKQKGADGTVERVNKNANDCTAKFTLLRTSPVNDALSAIHIQDKLDNLGVLPLTIKDLNGTSLFFAPQAWIKKPPEAGESEDFPNREWEIDTGPAANFIGGTVI